MLCLDPNISFIIPVFNGEEHLAASLLSLKKQDVTNWEAVIVDDGSIEHTSSISDALALSDSRIQAIHQNNGGVSIARNCGMDIARSNWIAWLDADDQYITGALRKIFSLIDSHQKCNCLQFPYLETCADGSVRKCISRAYNKFGDECYSGQRAFEILFATSPNFAGMNWQPWRFIYRHDSLPHFRNGIIHEDLDVLPLHLATMERVFISKEPLYAYLPARNGAATAVYTPRRVRDILNVTQHIYANLKTSKLPEKLKAGFRSAVANNLFGFYLAMPNFSDPERSLLLNVFSTHPEWLLAINTPPHTAWLKRLLLRLLGIRKTPFILNFLKSLLRKHH